MDGYLIVKWLHIVSVIAWMAALLYLPRLFVYHAAATPGGEADGTFKVMERKLLRTIANPAMIATWIFGLWLAFGYIGWQGGWLHAKVALVVALTIYHHLAARWRKDFDAGSNTRSERFYRMVNEVPAVIMLLIVFLVVLKPF